MSIITYYINCAKQSGASFSVVMFDNIFSITLEFITPLFNEPYYAIEDKCML